MIKPARRGVWPGRGSLLALVTLAVACVSPAPAQVPPAAPEVWLIRGVRVFDGETMLPKATVLVRAGHIADISAELAAPREAVEIDGAGMTLLPGLLDAHAHVRGPALRDELAFGVTTVLDMMSDVKWAASIRQEQRAGGGLDRADLYSAGMLVTAPGGHGTEFEAIPTLSSAAEAQAFVDARIAEGSDYIKIVYDDGRAFGQRIPTLSLATLKAVIDAAHLRHLLAVVHIGSVEGARDALEAGANGLAHLSPERAVDDELVALATRRGAFIVPTLSLNESLCGVASGASLVADPRLAPYLSYDEARNLTKTLFRGSRPGLQLSNVLTSVASLHRAGVPILAGTDAPNKGTWHGVSIHRELELLVRAGLTPIEALRAATSAPARAFGLEDRGRIAIGKRADLLLVRGDPASDILTTRDIVTIWKLGRPFDRAHYRAHLASGISRRWLVAVGVVAAATILLVAWLLRRTTADRSVRSV